MEFRNINERGIVTITEDDEKYFTVAQDTWVGFLCRTMSGHCACGPFGEMKAKCFHEGLAQGLAPGLFPSPTFLSLLTSHFIPNLHILQRTSTNRYSTVYQTSSFHVPQSLPTVKQSCGIYSWCLFFDADAGRMPNLSVYWAPLLFELLLPKFRKVAMNKNWYGDSNFFFFDLLNLLNIFFVRFATLDQHQEQRAWNFQSKAASLTLSLISFRWKQDGTASLRTRNSDDLYLKLMLHMRFFSVSNQQDVCNSNLGLGWRRHRTNQHHLIWLTTVKWKEH